jgi:aspartate aminotransferase
MIANPTTRFQVSAMAENLIGSEIIKLAGEINEKLKRGEKVYNFTIGDFDPKIFPIPTAYNDAIVAAYGAHQTNYPAANGMLELRNVVSNFIQSQQGLYYSADEILISGGARPLIYATYITLLDKGEKVVFPVPSWNNNHYCHLSGATPVYVTTHAADNFMPTASLLEPYLKDANLLALCSPLNPTGTVFTEKQLLEICHLVVAENQRRGTNQKPLYLMYDQIYSVLLFGENKHFDPVTLCPAVRDYTIYIDGISKSMAATGVRVGWAFGPAVIIDKMKAILSHVGAWAPKAEQIATANFMQQEEEVNKFLKKFKSEIDYRLSALYSGFKNLNKKGYKVDCIPPQAAIYLTIKLDLKGMQSKNGQILAQQTDVTDYMLNEAKLAVVPFSAFGTDTQSPWYRLSIGTSKKDEIPDVLTSLENALAQLQ